MKTRGTASRWSKRRCLGRHDKLRSTQAKTARWSPARSRTTIPTLSALTRRPASSRTSCRTGSLIPPRWFARHCRMRPRLLACSSLLRRWSPKNPRRRRRCPPCPPEAAWIIDRQFDKEYHVEGSRLQRFAWFRRKQELHFVHHRHANSNFAVIHFFWDRILGTYRRPDAAQTQ